MLFPFLGVGLGRVWRGGGGRRGMGERMEVRGGGGSGGWGNAERFIRRVLEGHMADSFPWDEQTKC